MIDSIDELERAVGTRPRTAMLKSIPLLDEHCQALLAASPLAVISTFGDDGVRTTAVGGEPGHVHPVDERHLMVSSDRPHDTTGSVGVLAMIPGYRETLRVNGRLDPDSGAILVEEAFLHCAKAIIRSELWSTDATTPVDADAGWRDFLSRSPFLMLGTVDARGGADVSPKGDPAGFVVVLDDDHVLIPDRPGNRRTDTMHNLLDDPRLGLLAMVPGDDRVLELSGTATITADPTLLDAAAVRDRIPKAGIILTITERELRREPGLERGRPWDPTRHVGSDALPSASCIWTDHVKLNETPGIVAGLARKVASPKMLEKGLARDYEHNLY